MRPEAEASGYLDATAIAGREQMQKQGQKQKPKPKPKPIQGSFAALRMTAKNEQQQRQQQEPIQGSFAALRMTAKRNNSNGRSKSKGRSRFPEGMTERKARAKATADAMQTGVIRLA
jgi:hypothetical protein